ncbi:MAG: hypothetical protein HP490_14215 [Nitrospira sp.]|nr:hypothetical protein [Nitrospira sp.]
MNRLDMTEGRHVWFEAREARGTRKKIGTFPRIGVEYAGSWAKKPWRFRLIEIK